MTHAITSSSPPAAWQPIASAPADRVVEIATFPVLVREDAVPRLAVGPDLKAAYPTSTHWRELSDDICSVLRQAILRRGVPASDTSRAP